MALKQILFHIVALMIKGMVMIMVMAMVAAVDVIVIVVMVTIIIDPIVVITNIIKTKRLLRENLPKTKFNKATYIIDALINLLISIKYL